MVQHAFMHDLLVGFRMIIKYPYLIQMMLLAMLANILFGLMTDSAPVMVIGVYEKTDHFYALLNFAAGVFGVSVIVIFNYLLKHYSIIKMGAIRFLLACLSCILLGFTRNYTGYLFLYALFKASTVYFPYSLEVNVQELSRMTY